MYAKGHKRHFGDVTQRLAIWLLPLVLALHNPEEGLTFPRYLPRVLGRLPAGAREWIGPIGSGEMMAARSGHRDSARLQPVGRRLSR